MRYASLVAWAAFLSSTVATSGYQDNSDGNSYGNSYGGNLGSDNSGSDKSSSDKSPSYDKGYGSNWNGGYKWDKTKSSWSKATQTILGQNSTVTRTQTQAVTQTEAVTQTQAITSTQVSTMLVTQTTNGVASTLIIIVNVSDGLPAATTAVATTTAALSFTTPETGLPPTTLSVASQATAAAQAANTSTALQLNATAPSGPAVFTGNGGQISVDFALTAAGFFALAAFLV